MTYRIKIADHMDLFRAAHEEIPVPSKLDLAKTGPTGWSSANWVKNAWQERYDVDIVYKDNRAQYLDFRDEKHYTWFVLSVGYHG